ncbi:MAG: ABC transporter substrate-binding protein [Desulfomonilaceae bacterium]|jgi:branched-chain amino acid transport system substrate-binding protein
MKMIVSWIAISLVLVPMTCRAENPTAALKVGVVLSMTGAQARFGEIQRNSFLLAVDEINKAGGVNGRQVAIIVEDDNGQPDLAGSAAEKLISEDGVLVLTGASRSEAGWAIAAVAEQKKVPFLITSGCVDEITEQGWEYVFRIGPPLSHYFGPLLSFLEKVVNPQTLALVCENSLFGREAANRFAKAFQKTGGKIVAREIFQIGSTDFRPMLIKVRNSKPDVVFMCSLPIEGALLMRQSQELNLTPKIFAGTAQGFTISQFMLVAGGASDHVFSVDLWSPRLPYAGAQKYFDDYVLRFLSSTDYHGAQAYACMQVIADAFNRTPSLTPSGVRQALTATDTQTVFGPVRFVSEGKMTQQNSVRTFLSQWLGGTLEIVWPKEFASEQYVYPIPPWSSGP